MEISHSKTNAAKLEQLRQAYESAFDTIYRYVRYRIAAKEEAEDVVADVFENAVARIAAFDPAKGNCQQWLMGIAKNQIKMHWRSRKSHVALGDIEHLLESPASHSMNDALWSERLLEQCTPEVKAILTLHYIDDLPYDEIATLLNTPAATLRQHVSRQFKKLRTRFAVHHR